MHRALSSLYCNYIATPLILKPVIGHDIQRAVLLLLHLHNLTTVTLAETLRHCIGQVKNDFLSS